MLCVLGLINFYNIPYIVFVVLLRTFLLDPSTHTLEISNAMRIHAILMIGAISSLGYGGVCCTFLLRDVRSHEHLEPVFGGPLLGLVLSQIASVPLTIAVFAVGFFQLRSVVSLQRRAAPRDIPRPCVHGVPITTQVRGIDSISAVLAEVERSSSAERDAALFFGVSDEVRNRPEAYQEYLEIPVGTLSERSLIRIHDGSWRDHIYPDADSIELAMHSLNESLETRTPTTAQHV